MITMTLTINDESDEARALEAFEGQNVKQMVIDFIIEKIKKYEEFKVKDQAREQFSIDYQDVVIT
jgi:hypothetical protein